MTRLPRLSFFAAFHLTIQGYPKLKREWEVPNPKDVIEDAMRNFPNLEVELATG